MSNDNSRQPPLGAPVASKVTPQVAPAAPAAPPPRDEEDSRTRAARRAEELREHNGHMKDEENKFFIDPRWIPDGWSYEYKRLTLLGKPDPSYETELKQKGWEAVPRSRHPFLMPDSETGESIIREGQILMERPLEITEEVRARDKRRAREQVTGKEQQLGGAPPGTFDRANKDSSLVNIRKTFEHIPIPK
jgi:hypothetical protein